MPQTRLSRLLLLIVFGGSLSLGSQSTSGLKLLKTKSQPVRFSNYSRVPIGSARYILSTPAYNKVQVYDLKQDQFIDVPVMQDVSGIDQPPVRPKDKIDRLRNQLAGKDWRYTESQLAFYDGKEAGYFYERSKNYKKTAGNPACACGGTSRLIEKYQRYYCEKCRKYVPTKDYMATQTEYGYYHFDLAAKKMLWHAELPPVELGYYVLGCDASDRQIYFSAKTFISSKKPESSDTLSISRLDLGSEKVDLTQEHPIAVRSKKQVNSWHLTVYHSPDFKWFAFVEYDEGKDSRNNPHLQSPPPQAYFVRPDSDQFFAVPIDVTTYGVAIDSESGFAVLASNQTGQLKLVDLAQKSISKIIPGTKKVAQAFIAPDHKQLFIVTKSVVTQYSWPSLKRLRVLPWKSIVPGVQQLLTAEKLYISGDGRYGLIGKLVRSKHGPWYSSEPEQGFHILEIQ